MQKTGFTDPGAVNDCDDPGALTVELSPGGFIYEAEDSTGNLLLGDIGIFKNECFILQYPNDFS